MCNCRNSNKPTKVKQVVRQTPRTKVLTSSKLSNRLVVKNKIR